MTRFLSKRGAVLDKRPGEMVYIGKNPSRETRIDLISYDGKNLTEKENIKTDVLLSLEDNKSSWINVEGLSDLKAMEAVKTAFNINPLIAADIINTGSRPKCLETGSAVYVVLKMLVYDDEKDIIVSEHLSLLIHKNILITFQEAEGDVFSLIRERLIDAGTRIRNAGVEYLAYSLMDSVVDNYFRILQNLADRIEEVEELLLEDPDKKVLKQIIFLKKELLFLSKAVKPAREAVKYLIDSKPELVRPSLEYFSDLYSNITQVVEAIDLYKEITTHQQNTYDTHMNHKLNEIMKFLTIFSVIFLPLTLITGIYGTNFDFIPELHFKYGYLFLWGLLVFCAVFMILLFKKKKWL